MNPEGPPPPGRADPASNPRGPIGFMARNDVIVNVVMLFLVIGGMTAVLRLPQEVIPDASLDLVQVLVPYPGATPEEVEESIVQRIEEQIRGVEGLERTTATASRGVGTVMAEFRPDADINRALNEVRAAVDRIPTFPANAERPQVREITTRQSVLRILVYGDVAERTLKELAYRIEEGISSLPDVSLARTSGTPPYEISIEVPRRRLMSLGLTLPDVADAVRRGSLELSAGRIATDEEEILVRTLGRSDAQAEFEDIIILTRPDGTLVRLGDIATVRDGFADDDLSVRYNGQPAARVDVFRTSDERLLDVTESVHEYLATEVGPSLPGGVSVATWWDDSLEVRGRLGLMVKNGLIGLALVFVALALFLEIRLAGWVAVGLAMSFMGTFLVMDFLDVSLNMYSLMGLILALGIVVDDAIVVGESIHSQRERGVGRLAAAIGGARRVAMPVIFSVLTTIAAFAVMLNVPGPQGVIGRSVPIVVLTVLLISLFESLLLLPNHLSHVPASGGAASGPAARWLRDIRGRVDGGLKRFVDGPLDRGLRLATSHPFVVLAAVGGLLSLVSVLMSSGIVPYRFATPLEGHIVSANIEMPVGTDAERTAEVAARVEAAGHRAVARVEAGRPAGAEPIEVGVAVTIGELATFFDPLGGDAVQVARGHLGTVQFKILEWERTGVESSTLLQAWRAEIGDVREAASLSLTASMIGGDLPVHFDLSHPDPARLVPIADELAARLGNVDGVVDIHSNWEAGARELQLELKPLARSLHLTLDRFAGQVRAAFFGVEAMRVQRGREDVSVYVRLPEDERGSAADVEGYPVHVPGGGEVRLGQVASIGFARSPSSIHRIDGRRAITVTADVDPVHTTGAEVNYLLERELLAPLAAEDPDFNYAFGGLQKQQDEVNGYLAGALIFAMLAMYVLMVIPFGSWVQPMIVLAAIPLGAIGAVAGHVLLGLEMGVWSMQGLIGVSGVVINDSLMLIRFINEARDAGMAPTEAIIVGSKARFRAILLTSITTFVGVAPLVFEPSTFAAHLVPLATSVGFGVLVATALLMLVIPALVALQYRFRAGRGRA